MGVYVTHLGRFELRILQCLLHNSDRTRPGLIRHSDVECICCHSVSNNLRVNSRPPAHCRFQIFEDHPPGPFPNDKAIAVTFKWPGSSSRILVSRRKCPHRSESGDTHWSDCRLSPAANHCIGIPALNDLETVTYGVRTSCTGGRRCRVRALGSVADGNLPRSQIDNCGRNKEG